MIEYNEIIARRKDTDRRKFSYMVEGNRFGLDVPSVSNATDEKRMSIVLPFADGNAQDGVGDVLEVAGIDLSRHSRLPLCLLDHGKHVQLPIGMCEDPDTKQYTVVIDDHNRTASATVFFYQGKGVPGVSKDEEFDHAVLCEQVFDLWAKKFLRGGSIGYSVQKARQIPANYEKGIPAGLHLLNILMLECSVVVLPASPLTVQSKSLGDDSVREIFAMPTICGKSLSPMLVKSLTPYLPEQTRTSVGFADLLTSPQLPTIKKAMPMRLGTGTKRLETNDDSLQGLERVFSPAHANYDRIFYDPKEGKYYDRHTDIYLTLDEAHAFGIKSAAPQGAKGMDIPKIARFNVEKSGASQWYVTLDTNRVAGPYESELEAKKKRDELARVIGDKSLKKDVVPVPLNEDLSKTDVPPVRWKPGRGAVKSQIPGDLEWLKEESDEIEHKRIKELRGKYRPKRKTGTKALSWLNATSGGSLVGTRTRDVKKLRQKYRSAKGLRRRVKSGRPSSAVVHVREKDLDVAKNTASRLGLSIKNASVGNGTAKLRIDGADSSIDEFARAHGVKTMRTKALPSKTTDAKGLIGYRAQGESKCSVCDTAIHTGDQVLLDSTTDVIYCCRECADAGTNYLTEEPLGSGQFHKKPYPRPGYDDPKSLKRKEKSLETKIQSGMDNLGFDVSRLDDVDVTDSGEAYIGFSQILPKGALSQSEIDAWRQRQGLKSMKRKGKSMRTHTKEMPVDDMEIDAVENEMPEVYSAQVLRRMHENASLLLDEYDELIGPMEHDGIKSHIQKRLESLVDELEELESLMEKHHPDIHAKSPLGGVKGMDEEDDLDDETAPKETGDIEEADSAPEDDLPSEDEVAEALADDASAEKGEENAEDAVADNVKALRRKVKRLRANGKAWHKSADDEEEDKEEKKSLAKGIKHVCTECRKEGKKACDCSTKALTRRRKPLDMASLDFQTSRRPTEKELHEIEAAVESGKTSGKTTTGVQWGYDEDGEISAAGYKSVKKKNFPEMENADDMENVEHPGMKALESRERAKVASASHFLKELGDAREFGEDHRMQSYHHHKSLGEIGGDAEDLPHPPTVGGEHMHDREDAPTSTGKALPPDAVDGMGGGMPTEDQQIPAEKGLHPHRKMCKDASGFFGELSRERAFGDAHRTRAKSWHKELDAIAKEEGDGAPGEEENAELPEPGEMGEKHAINRLKALLETQNKQMQSLQTGLASIRF